MDKTKVSHNAFIKKKLQRDPAFAAAYLKVALEDTEEPKVLLLGGADIPVRHGTAYSPARPAPVRPAAYRVPWRTGMSAPPNKAPSSVQEIPMRTALLAVLIASSLSCSSGSLHDAEHAQASVQQLSTNRAVAAERWFDSIVLLYEAGEPMTPAFVDQLVDAARQRAIARAEASAEPAARTAAYAAYRDFCGEVLRRIERGPEVKLRQAAQLRYAIADAEWRMAQVGDR